MGQLTEAFKHKNSVSSVKHGDGCILQPFALSWAFEWKKVNEIQVEGARFLILQLYLRSADRLNVPTRQWSPTKIRTGFIMDETSSY